MKAGLLSWIVAASLMSGATAAPLDAVSSPVMTAVTTGSNLAVWTLVGTPAGGAARHRTPVVYLHGGPGMYTEARRFGEAAVVRAAVFDTIFFDQAGDGKSALLPAGDYSLDRAVADIEALRVTMGHDRLVLWGNSYGADLAALYASRYPGHVAGVLLTSPGMFPGFSGKRDYGRSNRDRVEYAADVRAAIDRIDRDGAAAEATLPQAAAGPLFDALVADELMGGMVCKGASVRPPALPGGGNLYAQRLIFRDLKKLHAALPAIAGIPTLIVRGACDFLPMASAERYRAMLGGEIVEIAGSGHGLIENRAAVDAAIAGFARGALGKVE